MTIGTSLFLIALGAIMRFAIQDSIQDVDLSIVGLILMIVGVVGLLIGLWQTSRFTNRTDAVERDQYGRPV